MENKLTILNTQKIWTRELKTKWLPHLHGWVVSSVEEVGDVYIFELRSNGRFRQAEIQLRREPSKYRPDDFAFLYKMWAWSLEDNAPVEQYCSKADLGSIDDMLLRLSIMLDKIIPKG